MNEQELLKQIAEAENKYKAAQLQMAKAKKAWVDAESLVIETKINLERLQQKMREFKENDTTYVPDARDEDIARLKANLAELLKKV